MLTQEILDEEYVDGPAAAKILNITSNQVRFLCSRGKLKGAMKLGTSGWIIPRKSVLDYKPQKRGPKPRSPTAKQTKELIAKTLKELKEGKYNGEQ